MERERIEEIAANRLQIITPLLDPALDKAKHQTMWLYHYKVKYLSTANRGMRPFCSARPAVQLRNMYLESRNILKV